jgi:hypothetical protein
MSNPLINPHCHTNSVNDEFVGMKFSQSKGGDGEPTVDAIFPLGYHFSGITQDDLKRELYTLLTAIKQYSQNYHYDPLDGTAAHTEESKEFPFDAYMAVIRDFMQYGYYIEREIKYKNAPMGKIDWKRTIARCKPTIQDNRYPVYTDFIIRQNAKKADNLISLIHEWCVYEAFTKFGWIFTSFNPHKPTLTVGDGKDGKNERAGFVSVIRDALKSTFNDRNRTLFNAMIAMLRQYRVDGGTPFFYGTTHFHTVWEGLIDASYGIPDAEKRKFFPEAEWTFTDGKSIPANNIRPDTIMCSADDVFVLDAKYYSFIIDKEHVPMASDINKQVAYGEYAAKEVIPKPSSVYNAFLIPYDFESNPYKLKTMGDKYGYIGYSRKVKKTGKKEETYERVLGILIDTKWLMQNAGRIDKKGLAEFVWKEIPYIETMPVSV